MYYLILWYYLELHQIIWNSVTSEGKQKLGLVFQGGKQWHYRELKRGLKNSLFIYTVLNTGTVQKQEQQAELSCWKLFMLCPTLLPSFTLYDYFVLLFHLSRLQDPHSYQIHASVNGPHTSRKIKKKQTNKLKKPKQILYEELSINWFGLQTL